MTFRIERWTAPNGAEISVAVDPDKPPLTEEQRKWLEEKVDEWIPGAPPDEPRPSLRVVRDTPTEDIDDQR